MLTKRQLDALEARARIKVARRGGIMVFSPPGLTGEALKAWCHKMAKAGREWVVRDEFHEGI